MGETRYEKGLACANPFVDDGEEKLEGFPKPFEEWLASFRVDFHDGDLKFVVSEAFVDKTADDFGYDFKITIADDEIHDKSVVSVNVCQKNAAVIDDAVDFGF